MSQVESYHNKKVTATMGSRRKNYKKPQRALEDAHQGIGDPQEPESNGNKDAEEKLPKEKPSRQRRSEACYHCDSKEAQHICQMSACRNVCCGPVNGCSIYVEDSCTTVYFCHECFPALLQNNKKALKPFKTGGKTSKTMFKLDGEYDDMVGFE